MTLLFFLQQVGCLIVEKESVALVTMPDYETALLFQRVNSDWVCVSPTHHITSFVEEIKDRVKYGGKIKVDV